MMPLLSRKEVHEDKKNLVKEKYKIIKCESISNCVLYAVNVSGEAPTIYLKQQTAY